MAAFTTTMTTSTSVDDSIVKLYVANFIAEYEQQNVVDGAVEFMEAINGQDLSLTRYAALATATTALTEDEDVASVALSDSKIVFTPAEYGNVITTTDLAVVRSGGKAAQAAIRQIGANAARSMNVLGTLALEATANIQYAGSGNAADADVAAGDVLTRTNIQSAYNKLARSSVPFHSAGSYVAFAHDDVIADLRADTAAASWTDVNKYNNELPVLQNEVGMFGGFRWVRNNDCNVAATGTSSAKVYKTSFLGLNALGKVSSTPMEIRVTGPFDKLGRFVNVGWYTKTQYKIVESTAVQSFHSSSAYAV